MQMKIIVESQEDFDKWINQQTVFKNSLIARCSLIVPLVLSFNCEDTGAFLSDFSLNDHI